MDILPRTPSTLAPAEARRLLRRLRDLNLVAHEVAVDGGTTVTIDGCLSLDGPVEQGVRYRLRVADGPECSHAAICAPRSTSRPMIRWRCRRSR